MKEINIGVLGYGFMGKAHTYGYINLPLYYKNLPFKANLAAICTSQTDFASQNPGFAKIVTNEDEILDDPSIDVIDICTPNAMHLSTLLKAIKAGKHIYCEKPLVLSGAEAALVRQAIAQTGYNKIHATVFHNRFYPSTMRARQLIDEGRLGRILTFRVEYLHFAGVDPMRPALWRHQKKFAGAGTLFDLGSHVLDMTTFLLGGTESLSATLHTAFSERPSLDGQGTVAIDVDDAAFMTLRMKNGAVGFAEANKLCTGACDEFRFEIHGTDGALRWNAMNANWLDFYDNNAKPSPLGGERGYTRIECTQQFDPPGGGFPAARSNIGWLRAHAHSVYNFLSHVYEDTPCTPSLLDGLYIQDLMDRVLESNEQGRWVTV